MDQATPPDSSAQQRPASAARAAAAQARCKVCLSPDKGRIELAMARGAGKRATARAYGLSAASVWRHWQHHVDAKLKSLRRISVLRPGADLEQLVNEENTGVLENLKLIRAGLLWQFDQATQVEDRHGMAILSAQLHKNLETVAKLTGELVHRSEHINVSIALQDDVQTLCNELARILRPYPEVATLVAEKFRTFARPALPIRPPALEGAAREVSHAD